MPGTISLSLSQQFKRSGASAIPLGGGKLYFIQAGTTSAPQNAFQDFALTIPHPNPLILDEAGRIPAFYLDDGFIKVRLTDAGGLTQIEQDNLLVVGPSTGEGGGGGGGVDPTTVFQTGDVMWLDVQGSRTGWVRDNGRTIGSTTSGATERANADCEALFAFLWNNYSNTFCPVSTGRGVSASADWAANKTIQLRNKQGCVPGGLDDMGNTAAGAYASAPVISGSVTTASSVLGENTHALLKAELPATPPTGSITNGGITNVTKVNGSTAVGGNKTIVFSNAGSGVIGGYTNSGEPNGIDVTSTQASSTFTGDNLGSGTAHNVVQRTVLGSWYRKL